MEYLKHFSHSHGMVFHHVPQGSEIHCSACKSPGSGDVYACWQCSYFLHQHCFGATRSLNHPAHPLHTLTLMPSPTYLSGSFTCNSCNLRGHGLSYSCSVCEFDIHVHCALIPNPIYPPHIDIATYPPQTPLPIPNNPVYPQPNTTDSYKQELARIKKMEMEEELRRRRQNLHLQQLKRVSDSIDFMGQL